MERIAVLQATDHFLPKFAIIGHTKQRMLYFDTKTGIPSGKYPLPKLIFKLEGNALKVFALNRKDSITDGTPLYHAPLLNIGRQGNVCMGNASMDYDGFDYYEDVMGFVEQQFFRSVFTETHHTRLVDGNIVNVMKQNFGKPSFNDRVLIVNKMTLNELYEN
ncbi:MAG TPA: hypothetical protein ENH87_12685 [Pricia antarctica]|uniref:PRTRC system protein B n=3 Tax=root TaxID=1 RepID=A0A831QSA1_9FLAO|nr:hypothetical protein [Pricia antarctica]